MSGQSIMDRMTAAKHSLSGQGLAKVVCKATTEEVMGPKKKHLDCKYDRTNFNYYTAGIFRTTLKPSPNEWRVATISTTPVCLLSMILGSHVFT